MICPSCKHEISDTANFCVYCGERVGEDASDWNDQTGSLDAVAEVLAGMPMDRPEPRPKVARASVNHYADNSPSPSDGSSRPASRLPMLIVAGITSLAAVASLCWGIVSFKKQGEALRELHEVQARESASLASQADDLLEAGDRLQAMQVAMAALPSATEPDRPVVPGARLVLERALQVYPGTTPWLSCVSTYGAAKACSLTNDGLLAVALSDGNVTVSRLPEGEQLCKVDAAKALGVADESGLGDMALQTYDNLLLARSGGSLALFDITSGTNLWTASVDGMVDESDATFSHDGTLLALGTSHGDALIVGDDRVNSVIVRLVSTKDGSVSQAYKLPLRLDMERVDEVRMAFSPDDSFVVVGNAGRLYKVDLATGEVGWADLPFSRVESLDWTSDMIIAVARGSYAYSYDPSQTFLRTAAFAPELYQLWGHEEEASEGAQARLLGSVTSEEGYELLVMLEDGSVRLIDAATGEEMRRVEAWSPMVDAVLDDVELTVVDESGTVSRVSLDSDESELQSMGLSVGKATQMSIAAHEGTALLASWNESSQVRRTYRTAEAVGGRDWQEVSDGDDVLSWESVADSAGNPLLVGCDGKRVVAIDANSYERKWRRKLTKVGDLDGGVACASGDRAVYLYRTDPDAPGVAYALSSDDGSLLHTYTLDEGWGPVQQVIEVATGQGAAVALRGPKGVTLLDAETGAKISEARASTGATAGMWVAGDTLLMLEETIDGTGSLRLTAHALADGSDLGLPDGLAPLGGANAALRVAVSPDGSLVAVGSADGVLRCFDIGKWEFVWTGEAGMRPAHALAFVSGGDELFVQSDEGARMLLSAADGTVLATDATSVPLARSLVVPASGDQLAMAYGDQASWGIAAISLDEECFGVMDDVPSGVCLSPDGQSLLACDAVTRACYRYPCYSTEGLLELAAQAVEGHELSQDERHLLHIE